MTNKKPKRKRKTAAATGKSLRPKRLAPITESRLEGYLTCLGILYLLVLVALIVTDNRIIQ